MKTITLSLVEFILLLVMCIGGTSLLWYYYHHNEMKLLCQEFPEISQSINK